MFVPGRGIGPDGGFQGYRGGPGPRRGRGPGRGRGAFIPFFGLIGHAHPDDPGGGVINRSAENEEEPKQFSLLEYLGELLLQFFS